MVNRVTLIGRLTRDPEVVPTSRGGILANLRIATNSYRRDEAGNRQENTEFHSVVAFERLAEICQEYLHKGRLVYIEGRLRTRSWDDKDGRRHFSTDIIADTMHMLTPRPGGSAEDASVGISVEEPADDTPVEGTPSGAPRRARGTLVTVG
jgi:single-strand DNA-binding protein